MRFETSGKIGSSAEWAFLQHVYRNVKSRSWGCCFCGTFRDNFHCSRGVEGELSATHFATLFETIFTDGVMMNFELVVSYLAPELKVSDCPNLCCWHRLSWQWWQLIIANRDVGRSEATVKQSRFVLVFSTYIYHRDTEISKLQNAYLSDSFSNWHQCLQRNLAFQ